MNQDYTLREQFYQWRQRRPVKRFFATTGLFLVWLPRRIIQVLVSVLLRREQPERILIVHCGGLGDTLMLTPALAALQRRYPSARIDLITLHRYVADAFRNHPRLHSIMTLPAYRGQWIISRFADRTGLRLLLATLRCYPTLLLQLAFVRYGLGINFGLSDFDQRLGNALLYCLGVPIRTGARGAAETFLTQPVAVNKADHRVKTYLGFLAPQGIVAANDRYEFPVSQSDLEKVESLLRSQKVDSAKPLAVIHPGGKVHINSRRWPAEYFARVCSFLSSAGFEVVLTGDRDDAVVCNEIARTFRSGAKSIVGQLDFCQTAALLSTAKLCITNDTATLHLAEAVRVPQVVSIFGPTDPNLLAPQNARNVVVRSDLDCAPCMGGLIDSNSVRCWREVKEECLWRITPEQVISAVNRNSQRPARVASA